MKEETTFIEGEREKKEFCKKAVRFNLAVIRPLMRAGIKMHSVMSIFFLRTGNQINRRKSYRDEG